MERILFIEATELKGGIETFLLNTCKYINKSKYELTVLADCEKCSIEKELKDIGVKIRHIHSLKNSVFGYFRDLWRVIDPKEYDIVHINKNSMSEPFALLICKVKRISHIVVHSHNTQPTANASAHVLHNIFRTLLIGKKIIRVACSEQAAEWMFGDGRSNCLILKNGIELDRYAFNADVRKRVRDQLNVRNDEIAICSVGRLCEQKNSLFMIDIISSLVKINAKVKFFMIGSGELEKQVKEKVQKLQLESSVFFLGKRNDVNELLQGMDLFLMPSLHEGLPIAAVEAQAASLPLLISDTVDKGVRLLDSTEFEKLSASPSVWAEHCLTLIDSTERRDTQNDIRKSGYDVAESTLSLERLYNRKGNVSK